LAGPPHIAQRGSPPSSSNGRPSTAGGRLVRNHPEADATRFRCTWARIVREQRAHAEHLSFDDAAGALGPQLIGDDG
jgi:hypothetical protein